MDSRVSHISPQLVGLLIEATGVDLDWEVPTSQADKEGYVALVKEMKADYGTSFGMSIAFPVDYGDMFYIDAKGMEPYLNWIGYMSYDIGNPDGSIRAHTDITKVEANALPIWFDGIDPAKLNLGLASYGKGFTIKGNLLFYLKRYFSS